MINYIDQVRDKKSFTCPYCNSFALHALLSDDTPVKYVSCKECGKQSVWFNDRSSDLKSNWKMINPNTDNN